MLNRESKYTKLVLKQLGTVVPFILFQKGINNECSLIVAATNITFLLSVLKKHVGYQYNILSCISGADLLTKSYRYLISYELLSICYNSRLRIKLFVNNYDCINSSVNIFVNANWWEREIWDLFGLFFENHPDLRRILTDYGFEGHPLRKDFPLVGFNELRYDNNRKSIVYEPVALSQEFRAFNYETSW